VRAEAERQARAAEQAQRAERARIDAEARQRAERAAEAELAARAAVEAEARVISEGRAGMDGAARAAAEARALAEEAARQHGVQAAPVADDDLRAAADALISAEREVARSVAARAEATAEDFVRRHSFAPPPAEVLVATGVAEASGDDASSASAAHAAWAELPAQVPVDEVVEDAGTPRDRQIQLLEGLLARIQARRRDRARVA
jgi:fused signal recognition particle receptor